MEGKRSSFLRKIIILGLICWNLTAAAVTYGQKNYYFSFNNHEKDLYKIFSEYITKNSCKPLFLNSELSAAAAAYNRFIRKYGTRYASEQIASYVLSLNGIYDYCVPVVVTKKSYIALDRLLNEKIKGFFKTNSFSDIGISVINEGEEESIVLLFTKRYLQLESVPLANYTGQLKISGKLIDKFYNLRLYVMTPNKKVEEYKIPDEQKNFEFPYLFKSETGKYVFQIVGDDNYGTVTLALFTVYYSFPVESEKEIINLPMVSANPVSRFQAEEQLMDEINNLRRSSGLAPLHYSVVLAQAAAAHSTDMAENSFFSQGSYSEKKSVRNLLDETELEYSDYGVNVIMGKSIGDIIQRLNNLPYQRHNILDPDQTDYGVGVAVDSQSEGIVNYYVTEIFIKKKLTKFYSAQKEELLRLLNEKRNFRKMPPLRYAGQYAETAQKHVEEMADLDALGYVLGGQHISEKYRTLQGIKKYTIKLYATQQLKNVECAELYEPQYTQAAVGYAVSDSERYGKNTQWIVLVLISD